MAKMVEGRSKHPLGDLFDRSKKDVLFLEVGDRSAGDSVSYPDNDVVALFGADGKWKYTRKDGTPY
jgi:uncharacterized cupin superfamily protein